MKSLKLIFSFLLISCGGGGGDGEGVLDGGGSISLGTTCTDKNCIIAVDPFIEGVTFFIDNSDKNGRYDDGELISAPSNINGVVRFADDVVLEKGQTLIQFNKGSSGGHQYEGKLKLVYDNPNKNFATPISTLKANRFSDDQIRELIPSDMEPTDLFENPLALGNLNNLTDEKLKLLQVSMALNSALAKKGFDSGPNDITKDDIETHISIMKEVIKADDIKGSDDGESEIDEEVTAGITGDEEQIENLKKALRVALAMGKYTEKFGIEDLSNATAVEQAKTALKNDVENDAKIIELIKKEDGKFDSREVELVRLTPFVKYTFIGMNFRFHPDRSKPSHSEANYWGPQAQLNINFRKMTFPEKGIMAIFEDEDEDDPTCTMSAKRDPTTGIISIADRCPLKIGQKIKIDEVPLSYNCQYKAVAFNDDRMFGHYKVSKIDNQVRIFSEQTNHVKYYGADLENGKWVIKDRSNNCFKNSSDCNCDGVSCSNAALGLVPCDGDGDGENKLSFLPEKTQESEIILLSKDGESEPPIPSSLSLTLKNGDTIKISNISTENKYLGLHDSGSYNNQFVVTLNEDGSNRKNHHQNSFWLGFNVGDEFAFPLKVKSIETLSAQILEYKEGAQTQEVKNLEFDNSASSFYKNGFMYLAFGKGDAQGKYSYLVLDVVSKKGYAIEFDDGTGSSPSQGVHEFFVK